MTWLTSQPEELTRIVGLPTEPRCSEMLSTPLTRHGPRVRTWPYRMPLLCHMRWRGALRQMISAQTHSKATRGQDENKPNSCNERLRELLSSRRQRTVSITGSENGS